jgi:hypothetical protein
MSELVITAVLEKYGACLFLGLRAKNVDVIAADVGQSCARSPEHDDRFLATESALLG